MASHDEQWVRWHVHDDTSVTRDVQCPVHHLDMPVERGTGSGSPAPPAGHRSGSPVARRAGPRGGALAARRTGRRSRTGSGAVAARGSGFDAVAARRSGRADARSALARPVERRLAWLAHRLVLAVAPRAAPALVVPPLLAVVADHVSILLPPGAGPGISHAVPRRSRGSPTPLAPSPGISRPARCRARGSPALPWPRARGFLRGHPRRAAHARLAILEECVLS